MAFKIEAGHRGPLASIQDRRSGPARPMPRGRLQALLGRCHVAGHRSAVHKDCCVGAKQQAYRIGDKEARSWGTAWPRRPGQRGGAKSICRGCGARPSGGLGAHFTV